MTTTQVDGLDAVFGGLAVVLGVVAQEEQAAVDFGVEGFDAAGEDFGEAGVIGDLGDGDALVAQEFGGAAGGEEFDVEFLDERAGEGGEAGFIGERRGGRGRWAWRGRRMTNDE